MGSIFLRVPLACFGSRAEGSRAGTPAELTKNSLKNLLYEVFYHLVPFASDGIGNNEGIATKVNGIARLSDPDVGDAAAEPAALVSRRLVASDVDGSGVSRPVKLKNEKSP